MKLLVREELEKGGFVVLEEPKFPPSTRMYWSSYRPDLVAYRIGETGEELAVVECETHPNMGRFVSKNFGSLWFQPYLFKRAMVRWILAIPQGKLQLVNLELRRQWEIWILGRSGPISRIGTQADGGSRGEPLHALAQARSRIEAGCAFRNANRH
jgi:hypothetical protein